ncbi:hypothetical protein BA190_10035 [Labrys sp. WJW]|uniref:hypothetical protein n=1 Tax=Labrys sp. WJW TaxID=1737983 RepID=UPI0008329F2F|nr:hypothetical protein [Labrys sp. WJW]OCC05233.1 hypothetical protein BA190_10035 [Labrys sp. WJW]
MIWMQTSSGRAFDLLDPKVADVDLVNDVGPALARSGRYAGAVPGGTFSIAQHCVVGCDALMQETGRADLAAWFLLHDAHEAYIGDITSPMAMALDALVSRSLEHITGAKNSDRKVLGRSQFRQALGYLKLRCDLAIHAAAGINRPSDADSEIIHAMDLRMLKVERDQLCARPPRPWHPSIESAKPVPMRGRLSIWGWPRATDEWLLRLRTYCPNANGL